MRGGHGFAKSRTAGFTLVELLVVVGMIGVLAAIAILGYRKYQHSAQSGEARAVIQAIRGAEENYRAETLTYLDCSDGGTLLSALHPRAQGDLNDQKANFRLTSGTIDACYRRLNVNTDGPVRFSYATDAGPPGASDPPSGVTDPGLDAWPSNLPTDAPEPWYVILAVGDRDDDDTSFAYFLATSYSGEVYVENDSE